MVQMTTASANSNRRLVEALNEKFCGGNFAQKLINRLGAPSFGLGTDQPPHSRGRLADGSEPNSHAKKG